MARKRKSSIIDPVVASVEVYAEKVSVPATVEEPEPKRLMEAEVLRLQLFLERRKNLENDLKLKEFQVKDMQVQIKEITAQAGALAGDRVAVKKKLDAMVAENQAFIAVLREKYSLPERWGYDEESGDIAEE